MKTKKTDPGQAFPEHQGDFFEANIISNDSRGNEKSKDGGACSPAIGKTGHDVGAEKKALHRSDIGAWGCFSGKVMGC